VSEVTVELEGLRTAVDAFVDFLEVALGTREDRLWVACRRVTAAIESGVRHSAEVSLAMVEVSVGADFTEVIGFSAEKPLRFHEDLVVCYGPTKEAVAALIPAQQILVELPRHAALRAFAFFILLDVLVVDAWRLLFYQYDEMDLSE
jgi:hypothetical protein